MAAAIKKILNWLDQKKKKKKVARLLETFYKQEFVNIKLVLLKVIASSICKPKPFKLGNTTASQLL